MENLVFHRRSRCFRSGMGFRNGTRWVPSVEELGSTELMPHSLAQSFELHNFQNLIELPSVARRARVRISISESTTDERCFLMCRASSQLVRLKEIGVTEHSGLEGRNFGVIP
ncbi:MAG: hypothetical protein JST16_03755 [Bdellovibrionales bacterium]|nr:hypothetical protein [Bdellovibrionales bacterium]